MLKGLCGRWLVTKNGEVTEALGWDSGDGIDPGSTAAELCVLAHMPLSFLTSAALCVCVRAHATLGRLDLNILEVSSSSEILLVMSLLALWISALSPSWTSLHPWHDWQQSPSEKSFLGFYWEGNSGSHSTDFCPQSWPALMVQLLNCPPAPD